MRRQTLLFTLFAILCLSANDNHQHNFGINLDRREAQWVDSVFEKMTPDQRLGQLFVLRAHSDKDAAYELAVEEQVKKYQPGGLCFFQGTPERQAELTNRYQAAALVPLMISMDAEWGLGMRLKESTISYPKQLMLGALRDNKLIYEMGVEVARQCRRLGVHANFAPVADINNNPENPVINDRSFGEDRYNVAAKCFQYAKGLQDGGVLACAKHYPGHGDTNVDSHFDLPVINHSTERLDSLELFPFRVLSQFGVGSFMVAHLSVPALDARPNRPTTLSERTVHGLLRKSMGFDGLIFTDAMEMKGIAKFFPNGEADVEALRAGNDVILLPGDVALAIEAIKKALADGRLNQEKINDSVRRVLRAKYRLGLTRPQRVEVANIRRDLNTPEALILKRKLIADALTLVRDRAGAVPFQNLENFDLASLALGDTARTIFQKTLGQFAPISFFNAPAELPAALEDSLLQKLRGATVLVSLHAMRSKAADRFGLTDSEINFVRRLGDVSTVVLTVFGNPYSLKFFENAPTVLEAFTEDPNAQELAAQALFGAIDLKGSLPITVSAGAKFGDGVQILNPTHRLGYDLPAAVGMSADTLAQIDEIVRHMIGKGAAPGCQILVAKNNKVIFQKSYGNFTYSPGDAAVTNESIFDLASVTKVAATTISLMRLFDEKKFNPAAPLSQYLPELKGTNKQSLTGEEMLAHHAGLQAWIPFYEKTVDKNGFPNRHIYHQQPDADSEIPVAPGMFMENARADSVWKEIFQSDLRPNKAYKYSDLGLYLCARALQNISGKRVDEFADATFYRPLGLATTTFNPWKKGLALRCPPTEEDRYFRQQRVQGYVHDMGSAMLGGVAGHAGLFSNANDLAKIFQMLLNHGEYFGRQYLADATVKRWTIRFAGSTRRGIGFDMKELDPTASQNMSELASAGTFGHMGFTGISVWADPAEDLIFIFLSNRTYPKMTNNLLISENYRPKIQSIVYRSILKKQGS